MKIQPEQKASPQDSAFESEQEQNTNACAKAVGHITETFGAKLASSGVVRAKRKLHL